MAETTTIEDAVLQIKVGDGNFQRILWVSEVSFEFDHSVETKKTFNGNISTSNLFPECSFDLTRYTKLESVTEQSLLNILNKLTKTSGTFVFTTESEEGMYTVTLTGVRLDNKSVKKEAGQPIEFELKFKADGGTDNIDAFES